jgi:hypothetical protein
MSYYCIVSDIFVPQSVGFTIGFATALAPDMSPALSVALVGATFARNIIVPYVTQDDLKCLHTVLLEYAVFYLTR